MSPIPADHANLRQGSFVVKASASLTKLPGFRNSEPGRFKQSRTRRSQACHVPTEGAAVPSATTTPMVTHVISLPTESCKVDRAAMVLMTNALNVLHTAFPLLLNEVQPDLLRLFAEEARSRL